MLEVLGKYFKEWPCFNKAKAADRKETFHCHPTISPLCMKTIEGFGGHPISKGL